MSCAYWPPKSRTRIKLPAHPDALGALLDLAFRVKGRRVHDLGLLEFLDVLVACGRHARPEGAHQVQGSIVLVGGADEDLFERPRGPGADAGAAREGGVEGGHAPRVTAARRLFCFRERAAEHDGVGPAGYGLGHVPAGAHPAVGDDVDVLARLEVIAHASGGGVGHRGRLGHPDPDHTSRRTDTPRPNTDQYPHGSGPHEVQRRRVARASPDDDGHVERGDELHEVEGLDGSRDVLGGDDRSLDDEHVQARLYRGPVVALDPLGREGCRGYHALVLYLLDAAEDQLLLYGFGVDLLHHPRGLRLGQARYLLEDRTRVLVPGLQTLQVGHGQAPQGPDDTGRRRVHGRVERAGEARQVQVQVAQRPGDVYVLGVAGSTAGDYGDLVEPVGPARRLSFPDLDVHN